MWHILWSYRLYCGADTLQSTQKKSQSPYPTKAVTNAQNTDHKVIQFLADSPSTARGIPLMVGEVIGRGIDLTCVQLAPLLNCTNFITLRITATVTQIEPCDLCCEEKKKKWCQRHILVSYLPNPLRLTRFSDILRSLSSSFQRSSTVCFLVTLIQSIVDFKWNVSKINLLIIKGSKAWCFKGRFSALHKCHVSKCPQPSCVCVSVCACVCLRLIWKSLVHRHAPAVDMFHLG